MIFVSRNMTNIRAKIRVLLQQTRPGTGSLIDILFFHYKLDKP